MVPRPRRSRKARTRFTPATRCGTLALAHPQPQHEETTMTRIASSFAAAGAALALGGCAQLGIGGWTTLVDGTKGMENFNVVGQADWSAVDGAIQATKGGNTPSYLVTKNS